MDVSQEEWEAWKAEPITEMVFAALRHQADAAKSAWVNASWEAGELEPAVLAGLKARAEICEHLINWTAEDLEAELSDDEQD